MLCSSHDKKIFLFIDLKEIHTNGIQEALTVLEKAEFSVLNEKLWKDYISNH